MSVAGLSRPAPARLVLLVTSPRVPAGCLSWPAWEVLRSASVCTADPEHPLLPALAAAGVTVDVLGEGGDAGPVPAELARAFAGRASSERPAVWLCAPDGDLAVVRAVTSLAGNDPGFELEVLPGSWDLPGARLLDAVAVMDRLRSPGGCPWDAEQTHASLAPYLLEEAYEAYQSIEDGELAALRDEMGDVLLQVLFHARVASERAPDDPAGPGWTIDDVAGGLVDKLVRRHPHVFAGASAPDADAVQRSWDALKAAERGAAASVTAGVALGQPALALTAKLLARAASVGVPADLCGGGDGGGADVGARLFSAVGEARGAGVDAEAALRGYARAFRDRLTAAEAALRADGVDPFAASAADWRAHWPGVDHSRS